MLRNAFGNLATEALQTETISLQQETLDWVQSLPTLPVEGGQVKVRDEFASGEILPDQISTGGVLEFNFTFAVQTLWVYAVLTDNLDAVGEVRVDPFGGTPAINLGIPVSYGAGFPISVITSSVRVSAPSGVRVTIYGNRR